MRAASAPLMRRYLPLHAFVTLSSLFASLVLTALVYVVLFEPGLAYRITGTVPPANTEDFLTVLSSAVEQTPLMPGAAEVFADGAAFYPAELALIEHAHTEIVLEAFIFHATPVGRQFLAALVARARAGVKVRVVVDAVGSVLTPDHFFDPLRAAGGQVYWYQPFRWYTLKRWNNRTHRELLVVDGITGFIGGAGIDAAWATGTPGLPPWRDLMVRVDQAPARALRAVFTQSWLESSGEILLDAPLPLVPALVTPADDGRHPGAALVLGSTPTGGRATRARVLYQILIASARKKLVINTPYFVPDPSVRQALLQAVARGVSVTIITPGNHNNHQIARLTGRRHYAELIAGGIKIEEYQPGMLHTKIMLVDDLWSVVGSTNFDNRSFGLNNEINLILRDPMLTARLQQTLDGYLTQCLPVTLATARNRSWIERAMAGLASIVERQE